MTNEVVVPKQQRSMLTLAAILRATVDLLEDADFAELSVADIAAAAGVSVGTIYTRFADKNVLIRHLILELLRNQVSTFEALFASEDWRGVGLEQRVLFLTRLMATSVGMQPGLQRTVALRHMTNRGTIEGEEEELAARARGIVTTWLLECSAEIRTSSPEQSAAFALSLCMSSIQSALLFGADCGGLSPNEVADQAARAVLGCLRHDVELPDDVPALRWPGPGFKDFS